jgi:hypothetical protein
VPLEQWHPRSRCVTLDVRGPGGPGHRTRFVPVTFRQPHRKATEVGFNATRRYRDDKSNDIWLLVAAGLVLGAGLLWAFGLF